jgi:hypothetical protein
MKETSTPTESKDTPKAASEQVNRAGIKAMQGQPDMGEPTKELPKAQDSGPIHVPPSKELFMSDCKPNAVYEKNGYTYRMDELARPVEVTGKLKLKEGTRTRQQGEIGKMGRPNDDGGHLIGAQFDGPPDAFNIRPQNSSLNRGQWEAMENRWANSIRDGKNVDVKIEPQYIGKSIRPSRYDVNYVVNGQHSHARFTNRTPSE